MLSTTSEYALRALYHLARLPAGEAVLGRDLAELADIPPSYLSKIMLALRHAGLVDATRGLGGGYRLHRPAEAIRLIDVVELFDGASFRPCCLLGINRECGGPEPCAAHTAWSNVRNVYMNFLQNTSLSDISSFTHGTHGSQNNGGRLL